MKKTAENRYPYSATLFRFCKEALETRYEGDIKVIDQHVGSILGYDPADCSHWKKGKKNIRALCTLRSIANYLNVDERLLIDITSGKIELEEALFEYKGYGGFSIDGSRLDKLKKEFFKNPEKWQKGDNIKSFEELFAIDREKVVKLAQKVLEMGEFEETPVYMPEIYQLFPDLNLQHDYKSPKSIHVHHKGNHASDFSMVVFYKVETMRPYVRFLVAKEIFNFLCLSGHTLGQPFAESPSEVTDIQGNIFAGYILAPDNLLQQEIEQIDPSLDPVSQLAERFWISKALVNQRLRDYLKEK